MTTAQPYRDPPENLNGYPPHRDANGFTWSPDHAQILVDWFERGLKLTSGVKAGKDFVLEPWQRDYLATLNGWRDSEGRRRYRESLVFVPRKQGKSEIGAGLALFFLCIDGESRAQIYSAAKTREQASMVYEPAEIMARNSPVINDYVLAIRSKKRLTYDSANSYYQALASDAGSIHGTNPHVVLFDELHAQTNRDLYDTLKSGMGARAQPLFLSLTTAGYDRESICWEVYRHACNVRDGLDDARFLPLIYEAAPEADWTDEGVWRAANPNLGVTVQIDFLRAECKRAKECPAYENTFRRLYLNQWTEQDVRWIPMDRWDACESASGLAARLLGKPCWCALDLSSTTDLSAFAAAFPLDGRVALLVKHWRPADGVVEAGKRDRIDYAELARRGRLSLTPGRVVDHEQIRRDINAFGKLYDVREIAIDRWNAAQITQQLSGDGFAVVEHGQGYGSMSAPAKEFEKLVIGGELEHEGCRLLRWEVGNVTAETDAAGNIKPSKAKSLSRIDGVVAGVMACGRAVSAEIAHEAFFVTG